MASGSISLGTSQQTKAQILWEGISNGTQANSSLVSARLQIKKTNGYTTTGTWEGSLTVGSKKKNYSHYGAINGWVTVAELSVTVPHNPDGTGTCCLAGSASAPGGTTQAGAKVSRSATVSLDTIPRYAYLVTVSNFTDEQSPKITYANPVGEVATDLQAKLLAGGREIAVRALPAEGTEYTFQLTAAERNALRAATPNSNTLPVTFTIRSSIGGAPGEHSLPAVMTVVNGAPTITPTITDTNSKTVALTGDSGKLVRYFSNASVTMGAAAVKQASLAGRSVTNGTQELTADGVMEKVETDRFTFYARDSRGNEKTLPVSVPFVPYRKPTCTLRDNLPDGQGVLQVVATGSCFTGSFGAENNRLRVYCLHKKSGGSYGSPTEMTVTTQGNTYTAAVTLSGLDYQSAYTLRAYAEDALAKVDSAEITVKATPVFDWGENDFKFHVPVHFAGGTTGITTADIIGVGARNILNNTDFTNPVNQRGEATYNAAGDTIDMWRLEYTQPKVTIQHGYVNLTVNSAEYNYFLRQRLPKGTLIAGKMYTLAIKLHGRDISVGSVEASTTAKYVSKTGFPSLCIQCDTEYDTFGIYCQKSTSYDIEWVALYEGAYTAETIPPYVPKGYGVELVNCNVADSGNPSGTKLLWENASPTSTFAAQTVSVDLRGYDIIIVEILQRNTEGGRTSAICFKGVTNAIMSVYYAGINRRTAAVSDTGIVFSANTKYSEYYNSDSGSTDNARNIPVTIYGIKGVTA